MKKAIMCLDSNDRFCDDETKPYLNLPHNQWGFNAFVVDIDEKDDMLYKGKIVLPFSEYKKNAHAQLNNDDDEDGIMFSGKYDYYYIFVTSDKSLSSNENTWIRSTPLIFDGNAIIDCWVCLYVLHEKDAQINLKGYDFPTKNKQKYQERVDSVIIALK
jgi:hypothetical protein